MQVEPELSSPPPLESSADVRLAELEQTLRAWAEVVPAAEGDPQKFRDYVEAVQREAKTLRDSVAEARKRESELVHRLTQKQKDRYSAELLLKQAEDDEKALRLKSTYMDQMMNENFKYLQSEVARLQKQLETAKEDLNATIFSTDSIGGRALIARCKKLQEQNELLAYQAQEAKLKIDEHETALKEEFSGAHEILCANERNAENVMAQLMSEQDKLRQLESELAQHRSNAGDAPQQMHGSGSANATGTARMEE